MRRDPDPELYYIYISCVVVGGMAKYYFLYLLHLYTINRKWCGVYEHKIVGCCSLSYLQKCARSMTLCIIENGKVHQHLRRVLVKMEMQCS